MSVVFIPKVNGKRDSQQRSKVESVIVLVFISGAPVQLIEQRKAELKKKDCSDNERDHHVADSAIRMVAVNECGNDNATVQGPRQPANEIEVHCLASLQLAKKCVRRRGRHFP